MQNFRERVKSHIMITGQVFRQKAELSAEPFLQTIILFQVDALSC